MSLRRLLAGPSAILTRFIAAGALVVLCASAPAAPASYSFRWLSGSESGAGAGVELDGVDADDLRRLQQSHWQREQWQDLLSIYADQGDVFSDVGLPPVLGAYQVEGSVIRFAPRFPWHATIQYRAVFRPNKLPNAGLVTGQVMSSLYRTPARKPGPPTVVTHVFPSGAVVPENLLKLYVHFSAPMSGGHVYKYIHLQNDKGEDVDLPFLELDEELWDPEMKRLTLIIDPGRIKRGVRPLEEIGPALETGKQFTFVVDREWPDAGGQPLKSEFRKVFNVGPPDREPLEPARWVVHAPAAGSRASLTVNFQKAMDHAIAQRVLQVTLADGGARVPGKVELAKAETEWHFVPDAPWRSGRYELLIPTTIEDLAGNNIGKSFEVDLFEKIDRQFVESVAKLPFEVR